MLYPPKQPKRSQTFYQVMCVNLLLAAWMPHLIGPDHPSRMPVTSASRTASLHRWPCYGSLRWEKRSSWPPSRRRPAKTGWRFSMKKISPKSIPNSEKQKQLPNTQWMKYVYCPALFTLEVGRASCNHGTNTVWKKRFSKSVCDTVANMPEARAKGSLPKELLSASLFTSST